MKFKTKTIPSAFILLFLVVQIAAAQQQKIAINKAPAALEISNFQVFPIKDSATERNYELYVKLPESYTAKTEVKYPVLYTTDAIWHLEILSAATEYILEDIILVGISWQKDANAALKEKHGAHVSRFWDYSMQPSDKKEIQEKYNLGQASRYLDFIQNDVMPYVETHFRADTQSRTYFGYSLGGQFGTYTLMTRPDTFHNYVIGSPSIKTEIDFLTTLNTQFDSIAKEKNKNLNANVFLSRGTLETEMEEPIEALTKLLNGRRDSGLSLQSKVIVGNHQSAFPMTAVRGVSWLATILKEDWNETTDLPFFQVPRRNHPLIQTAPKDNKDGILVGELGVHGGDKEMILKVAQAMSNNTYKNYDSFLIYQKDKLLFESYYARGRGKAPHPQASATKAYTGMALGRAIQMGYLTMEDLEKPLVSFLKELDPKKFAPGAERITLHKALTMSTGIRIAEEQWEDFRNNPSQIQGQQQVQAMLEHTAPITPESQTFLYGTGPGLVMQVIEAKVPGTAKEFIKTELLDKLGIHNYNWRTSPSGLPESGWRTSFTSRDMVKWGILAKSKGKWNGEQLIPENFMEKAMSRILLTGDDDVNRGGKEVSKQGY